MSPQESYTADATEEHRRIAIEILASHEGAGAGLLPQSIAWAIAEAEERGRRLGAGGNLPPSPLMPEKLIDPEALPALFAENYPDLVKRGEELKAGVERWKAGHLNPTLKTFQIPSDADNNKTADFLRILASYAGGKSAASGEVNEAREKVKRAPFDACKVIDAWFNNLRDDIRADMLLMDRAQTAYLRDKAAKEQADRDRIAAAALEEANRLAEAARAADGAEDVVEQAVQAEARADDAVRAAEATPTEMTRTRSASGTTSSLVDKWIWRLTDIKALAKAVAAGDVPAMFLTTNDAVIGAAVRPKGGLRECPGLVIENDAQARRSGRTS